MTPRKPSAHSGTARTRTRVAELEAENLRLLAVNAQLEVERDDYAELYKMAPIAAVTLDHTYYVQRTNNAGAELLMADAGSLIGKPFRTFVSPRDRPSFAASLSRSTAAGAIERVRVLLEPPLCPGFPVEIWARFSRERARFELRLLDLRDQDRAEQEARRLAESERNAREASAAKDKFIAVLSHELRAPLTPVLAAASALRMKPLPEPLREAFEMIERNVSAEARLIDDLLDVNRIVRNKMQVECRNADVHQIAREAMSAVQPDVDAKRHSLEIELTARDHHASVDPLRLRQVFTNLLKNAIKFTPPGGRVRLVSWNHGDHVALEVEDNGLGIEPEAMQRLFEPFMEEERTTQVSGGLGLGLAISKGLIELQGGKITAHSRGRGRGARFVVEIPTALPELVEEQPVVMRRSDPPPSSSEDERPHVLLVDDHEDTVEILCDLLTDYGFVVQTANSVQSARGVDLEHVDVIVSDIGLPDGSGFDLMRELRTRTKRPAIALTGFGMESDVRASEDAGFDVHLTKPIDIDRLLSAIERLSSKARRARSGDPPSGATHSAPANPAP